MAENIRQQPPIVAELQLLHRLQQQIPEADREELASLLGLRVLPQKKPASVAGQLPNNDQGTLNPPQQDQPSHDVEPDEFVLPDPVVARDYPPREKTLPFLYLSRIEWKEAPSDTSGKPPQGYIEAEPFHGKVESPVRQALGPPEPLCTWAALWPRLLALFCDERTIRRLNMPKLIDHSIKRQPLRRLPWQSRLRWPSGITLLVDASAHLAPYFRDYEWLAGQLAAWFHDKLRIIVCTDGERQTWLDNGREIEGLPEDIVHSTVLYLGDLGLLDRRRISTALWRDLGRELHQRGCRPHALLTVSPPDVKGLHGSGFSCHAWDFSGLQPLVCRHSAQTWISPRSRTDLDTLLAWLSPAIEISPALVRRMRQTLGLGISVESLLIQHPDLKGRAVRFQWCDSGVQQKWRQKLAQQGETAEQQAWHIISEYETTLPVELQIEQRQKQQQALSPEQQQWIWRAVKTTATDEMAATSQVLLGWIERVARRAGLETWTEETRSLYALYWRQQQKQNDCVIPPGIDPNRLPEFFVGDQQPRSIQLLLHGDRLQVVEGKAPQPQPGIFVAGFEATQTSTLQNHVSGVKQPLIVGPDYPLERALEGVEIDTPSQRIILDAIHCPPWASGIGRDRYGLFVEVEVEGVEFVLRWIPPGEFLMGSPEHEPGRNNDEGPQHTVRFEQGFWLSDTVCTQALWQVVTEKNPSQFYGKDRPVENVSWHDVAAFIERINQMHPGLALRMPTEAEWEYACRAGTTSPFWFESELTTELANFAGNYPYTGGKKWEFPEGTVPVKKFQRNPWGLYQMNGNVWEWCKDRWHESYEKAPENGSSWSTAGDGEKAVMRGGSWNNKSKFLRSAVRGNARRIGATAGGGFRLARSFKELPVLTLGRHDSDL